MCLVPSPAPLLPIVSPHITQTKADIKNEHLSTDNEMGISIIYHHRQPPQDLPTARARAYDLVYNGVELGGGSLRIYRADVQRRVFEAIGLSEQEANDKFGYLLDSFQLGAPPHGGIALGVDRLVMLLAGTLSVIWFDLNLLVDDLSQ